MEFINIGAIITASLLGFFLGMWFKKLKMEEDVMKTTKEFESSFQKVTREVLKEIEDSRDEREGIDDLVQDLNKTVKDIDTKLDGFKKYKKIKQPE